MPKCDFRRFELDTRTLVQQTTHVVREVWCFCMTNSVLRSAADSTLVRGLRDVWEYSESKKLQIYEMRTSFSSLLRCIVLVPTLRGTVPCTTVVLKLGNAEQIRNCLRAQLSICGSCSNFLSWIILFLYVLYFEGALTFLKSCRIGFTS